MQCRSLYQGGCLLWRWWVPAKLIWGFILQYNVLVGRGWVTVDGSLCEDANTASLSGLGLTGTDSFSEQKVVTKAKPFSVSRFLSCCGSPLQTLDPHCFWALPHYRVLSTLLGYSQRALVMLARLSSYQIHEPNESLSMQGSQTQPFPWSNTK